MKLHKEAFQLRNEGSSGKKRQLELAVFVQSDAHTQLFLFSSWESILLIIIYSKRISEAVVLT